MKAGRSCVLLFCPKNGPMAKVLVPLAVNSAAMAEAVLAQPRKV